jgi:hypothetical protein
MVVAAGSLAANKHLPDHGIRYHLSGPRQMETQHPISALLLGGLLRYSERTSRFFLLRVYRPDYLRKAAQDEPFFRVLDTQHFPIASCVSAWSGYV